MLVVDDDPDSILILSSVIDATRILHRFAAVTGRRGALDALTAHLAQPSDRPLMIVWLDRRLLADDGIDVLREIRSLPDAERVVLVVLSASIVPEHIQEAYRLGADAVVQKYPVAEQVAQLVRIVQLTGYRRGDLQCLEFVQTAPSGT